MRSGEREGGEDVTAEDVAMLSSCSPGVSGGTDGFNARVKAAVTSK